VVEFDDESESVAEIVWELRCARNFGLIHHDLESGHLPFDDVDRTQFADFGLIDLEVHEGQYATETAIRNNSL
jgi:hypothetical protein